MDSEISSDVPYLISLIDEIKNNKNVLSIIYGNEHINGSNRLAKEQTQHQPNVKIDHQFQNSKNLTLVCYLFLSN